MEFTLVFFIPERTEQCTVEKVFKEIRRNALHQKNDFVDGYICTLHTAITGFSKMTLEAISSITSDLRIT